MSLKVEMHQAYCWDCDQCGAENFVRAIRFEGSEEDMQELRDDHGVQPWEEGDFVTYPDEVTCSECGSVFESEHD